VIDLHAHILPGLDDGAADLETSIAMSRSAVAEGIRTVVATPHVNRDYPADPQAMAYAVGALNVALARTEIPLAVLPGGELALTSARELDDDTLRAFRLAGGDCLLLESPYGGEPPWLEDLLGDLRERGFRVLLAHPERAPVFQDDPERLARLVETGVLCTVNAGSMTGRSGAGARGCVIELFRRGLVHAVSSDAHDDSRRPPRLLQGFEAVEADLPGLSQQCDWYTSAAPAAILGGEPLPEQPKPRRPSGRLRRLFGRSAG
jgi:protein-tyrosine phosphatase